ncbi:hypothetical protein KSS87_013942 [Heliosperma pusillum]|nr:hypothetical protein KSS87_013942 [Heliosperma pusillum]
MPSRMCINPMHNKKGLLHQSGNASSDEGWMDSSCAMDSLYDLDLISKRVPVILDNSEMWHRVLSTAMKLGARGVSHVDGVSRRVLKDDPQYANLLLINRTASPLAWFMECKDRKNSSAVMLPHTFLPSMATKKLRDVADKIKAMLGEYDAIHVRRGDIIKTRKDRFGDERSLHPHIERDTRPEFILRRIAKWVPAGRTLYIASNERTPRFFSPLGVRYATPSQQMAAWYKLAYSSNYTHILDPVIENNYQLFMIERLILTGAKTFIDTYKSDDSELSLTDDPKKNTKVIVAEIEKLVQADACTQGSFDVLRIVAFWLCYSIVYFGLFYSFSLVDSFVCDGIDGWFARKLNQVSTLGAVLDMVTDRDGLPKFKCSNMELVADEVMRDGLPKLKYSNMELVVVEFMSAGYLEFEVCFCLFKGLVIVKLASKADLCPPGKLFNWVRVRGSDKEKRRILRDSRRRRGRNGRRRSKRGRGMRELGGEAGGEKCLNNVIYMFDRSLKPEENKVERLTKDVKREGEEDAYDRLIWKEDGKEKRMMGSDEGQQRRKIKSTRRIKGKRRKARRRRKREIKEESVARGSRRTMKKSREKKRGREIVIMQ